MKDESVTVTAEHKGYFEGLGIAECLLDTCANGMVVVFRLNHSDRDIGLVVENVVSAFSCTTSVEFSPDVDPAIGEGDFLAYLDLDVPARRFDIRRDELCADVAFAKVFFIHTTAYQE